MTDPAPKPDADAMLANVRKMRGILGRVFDKVAEGVRAGHPGAIALAKAWTTKP